MIRIKTTGFHHGEISEAARIQVQELSQGFLTSLGHRFLQLLFAHAAESPWGILAVAQQTDRHQVVGYVLGAIDTRKLYQDFLLKKTLPALVCSLPKLLSPRVLAKALETLRYPAIQSHQDWPCAELLDLAVATPYHGAGIAQDLFLAFAAACRCRGATAFRIPTSESLARAHRFYEKMGARRAGSVTVHNGQTTLLYLYDMER